MMRVGDSQSGTLGSDYVLGRRFQSWVPAKMHIGIPELSSCKNAHRHTRARQWDNVPDTGRAYHTTCPPWAAQTLELSQLPLWLLSQPPEEQDIFSEIKNCVWSGSVEEKPVVLNDHSFERKKPVVSGRQIVPPCVVLNDQTLELSPPRHILTHNLSVKE